MSTDGLFRVTSIDSSPHTSAGIEDGIGDQNRPDLTRPVLLARGVKATLSSRECARLGEGGRQRDGGTACRWKA